MVDQVVFSKRFMRQMPNGTTQVSGWCECLRSNDTGENEVIGARREKWGQQLSSKSSLFRQTVKREVERFVIANHCVQDGQEFTHAGNQSHLLLLARCK